jgi:hypothetical protein
MDEFYTQPRQKEDKTGNLRLQMPLFDGTLTCEVTGDFSLPDYQPEIKRLLRVSATLQPPTHYIGGGSAEFSGVVDFCMLYAGNDGQLYCFPASSEYSFRMPMEAGAEFDMGDAPVCYAMCEAESMSGRVGGPRRMSVRCRIRARVRAHATYLLEEKRKGQLPAGCGEERLWREIDYPHSVCGTSRPIALHDEIGMESELGAGEWRIVCADAQIRVEEVVPAGGRVTAKGEALLKLLLQNDGTDALPVTVWRKLPFEGAIPVEAMTPAGEAIVEGCCTELNLSMEDDRVLCDADVVLTARATVQQTLAYTSDWYATGCESSCVTTPLTLPHTERLIHTALTQSESRALEELGIALDACVADVSGVARVDGLDIDRGRYVLTGKCRYTLILRSADGEMMTKEIELPWRYVADGTAATEHPLYEADANVLSARVRMDGERLAIDGEIGLDAGVWSEQSVEAVSTLQVGEALSQAPGEMVLCYPAREDTLWSVGKRYHRPIDALVAGNGLGDERRADDKRSLSDVRVIAI